MQLLELGLELTVYEVKAWGGYSSFLAKALSRYLFGHFTCPVLKFNHGNGIYRPQMCMVRQLKPPAFSKVLSSSIIAKMDALAAIYTPRRSGGARPWAHYSMEINNHADFT
jgi:hypothetical protein